MSSSLSVAHLQCMIVPVLENEKPKMSFNMSYSEVRLKLKTLREMGFSRGRRLTKG